MTAEWEPPGLSPWLGFATDSTAVLGRSSQCSGTRFVEPPSEARLTVYGCEGGSGTVELRAGSITGRLLDSITITVRTPTPTPTPVTPSGELSATKTSIVVGDEVTVSAVNVVPSDQSVYIVTNGRLGFAGPGTCHFEINPRSSEKSTRSWTLEGCSPPGSGSVTLKTRHNGQTLVLDSITIDVSPAPTATPTPNRPLPTATPPAVSNLVATASTTSVRLSWNELDGATKYRVEHRLATSTGAWTPVDTTAYARNVTNLMPDTSYAFKIRAYGDGTKYEAAWGAEAATTEDTVALAKPPAPAGLGASAPSQTAGRVTLTWSRLTGADKYEVEYRRSGSAQGQGGGAQGRSAGNWVSHDDAITAPGPTITHHVDGLTCGQEHDFRVQSHGDPATALFLDDWGEQWATISETPQCGTTPPTPTPTTQQPNSVPSFSESSTSVVFAEGVFATRTLPRATGGDGTLTYRVSSPALGNGLTLNQPTSTASLPSVSGNPLYAQNTVEYTYSVEDEDGDTASIELRVTVFDVSISVWAPIVGGGRRWVGIGDHNWWVAEHLPTKIDSGVTSTASFRFRIRIPASTGFQLNTQANTGYQVDSDSCVWPHPSTAKWSVWVAHSKEFPLVRCALGSGGYAGVEIQVKEGTVVHDLDTVPLSMPQARHRADHRVRYYVPSSSNTLLDRASSVYASSTAPWEAVVPGMVSFSTTTISGVHVTVEIGAADECGQTALACVVSYFRTRPHLTLVTLHIKDPPAIGKAWIVDYSDWSKDPITYEYLPGVLLHEFGHTLGLDDTYDTLRVLPGSYVGIMRDHKREVPAAPFDRCDTAPADQCGLSDHDRNALKAIYQGHSRH